MDDTSLVESCADEWSRYYHLPEAGDLEVLHARFVEHRFARHSHDYFVVSYIETGVQAFCYRHARHITPAGQMFLVNAGEAHTGEPGSEQGYVYRTMYPRAALLEHRIARLKRGVGDHDVSAAARDAGAAHVVAADRRAGARSGRRERRGQKEDREEPRE